MAAVALTLLLTGCSALLSFELYSSDLQEMVDGKKSSLDVNAVIEMEYSESNYEEMKTLIAKYFRGAQNFRAEKQDYTDVLKADYKLPVILSNAAYSPTQDLIVLALKPVAGSKSYELGVAFNTALFKTMNEEAQAAFFSSVDMDDTNIKLEFNNDLPDTLRTTWKAVYVNGEPVPIEKSFAVARRGKLEIEFSEIFKKALELNNEAIYFAKVEW